MIEWRRDRSGPPWHLGLNLDNEVFRRICDNIERELPPHVSHTAPEPGAACRDCADRLCDENRTALNSVEAAREVGPGDKQRVLLGFAHEAVLALRQSLWLGPAGNAQEALAHLEGDASDRLDAALRELGRVEQVLITSGLCKPK